ncbi:MAG: lipopolysaccharide kinase InaA family protein [Gemmataceae bacterium]
MIVWHRSPAWPMAIPLELAAWPLEPIKRTPHRDVFRVRLPGLDVHVKHYRPDGREALRWWVRLPKAQSEYERGQMLRARGIPTLEPLAWGRDGLHSYLVTRTLPDATPLLDELQRLGEIPRDLPERLGRFLARCHAAGVSHADLHPGNLLLTPDGCFHLIDLHLVHVGLPLAARAALANLVLLDRWFALRASRSQRLRALRAYQAARPELSLDPRDLAQATAASLRQLVRELDQRCRGKGRHYARIPGGLRTTLLEADAVTQVQARADALLDAPEAKVLKRSASSTVIECEVLLEGQPTAVVLKRVDATRWTDSLATWFRPDAVTRSWRMGHAMSLRGLPSPRCLAVWHVGATGYLLQEKVPQPRYLKEFLAELPAKSVQRKRDLLRQVGRLVRRLHEWGIRHRDLKAPNLLVSPARAHLGPRGLEAPRWDGGDHLWLVDLVGARLQRQVSLERRQRDLARLAASFVDEPTLSQTDRLRVLLSYRNEALRGRGDWKRWWRRLTELIQAKRRRNQRLGRVLG